jgi:hypothetical protein
VEPEQLEAYLRQGLSLEAIGELIGPYDRCIGALQFHHRDGRMKEFGLADRGLTRSLEAVQKEAAKCVLLCANCHAEVEAGIVRVA